MTEVRDAAEALVLARALRPALVLLPLTRSGTTDLAVLREIRADPGLADVSVVLWADRDTTPETRAEGLDAGADGCVVLPLAEVELLARIRLQLRRRAERERSVARGGPGTLEHRIVMPDGRVKHVDERWRVFVNADGRPAHAVETCQDTTERWRSEAEQIALSARLSATLESIPDAFLTLDREGRVSYVNHEAEEMFGRERAGLVGALLTEAFPGFAGTVFNTEFERALRGGVTVTFADYYPALEKWLEVRAYPTDQGLAVYLHDATRSRADQQRLRLLETCVATMDDVMLVTDADTAPQSGQRIVFVNEAFERATGYTRSEVIGRTPRIMHGPKTDREELDRIRRAVVAREGVRAELVNYTKEGREYWVELNIVPLRSERGEVTHFVAVQRDITTRKRAEEELRRAVTERLKGERELVRINRALQMLTACNGALIRESTEGALLNAVCRTIVEIGGMRLAWVGYAQEDESRTVAPQAQAGATEDFLTLSQITWKAGQPTGEGPVARAIRGGGVVVVPDNKADPCFAPRREATRAHEFHGVVALPLKDEIRTFGVLVLYLPEARIPPPDELHLLRELAEDVAFGILNLRVRAKSRVAQQEIARQAALLDKATDAIFVRDLEHRVTYWNKSAERLYGWNAAEITGRSVNEVLHRADDQTAARAMETVLSNGEWAGEFQKLSKTGLRITVEARWTLVRDEQGKPHSILAINTDVTERKKLEAEFLRAQRLESIGTLAGGIAHDLNNLLLPIMMGVDLLKQTETRDMPLSIIRNIERSAKRGADLVRQVLSFARGVEGERIALQLSHIVAEIEAIVRNTFPKNITLERVIPPDLWSVRGDPTQLNQVLLNLCVNARDAMAKGGVLAIRAQNVVIDEQYALMNPGTVAGRYVMLEVSDEGCGMAKEIAERVFEPFFTTKELGHGTGLGLSTVLGIVRSHGGFANVYSEPGKGSLFKVHLPADVEPEGPAHNDSGAPLLPRGQGELILVVDDEVSILDMMRQTLESFGYRVLMAEDGAQAIGLFALHRAEIAVVLTDMMMPVMDGPALIAALRRIEPGVRVIAASGLNTQGNVAKAGNTGALHFLAKPYSADRLLVLLRAMIDADKG